MEVYGYIYLVRNKVNGKMYFGKTENDFKKRYSRNIAKYTHNEHLKNSINTYGIENFEIIEQFDVAYNEDDLWDLEDMYICLYNTLDNRYGYNKRRSGSKRKGHGKASDETRQKIKHSVEETWQSKTLNEKQQHAKKTSEGTIKAWQNMSQEKKQKFAQKCSETQQKLNGKKVICLNTMQVFSCVAEASRWHQSYGGAKISGHICSCCKGKLKSAGKHPITGEKLHWMYYSDYLEQQNKNNPDSNNNKIA